eukprot:CAMPEP_0194732422 /NCGR_PEP_ID=MMETSP0296-20130528/61505_1 /TAXON_ID=39354 /ORGANISM="Heterosigma akashiwo, Strain CCMP2393" /LENGTH=108 /DNA_ID=CAMNT_0039640341 /DNA_START=52 /DNA_END=375 /DNA_ORIENTATION=+
MNYTHQKVNHSEEFKNADGFHTNKIESHWWLAKRSMPRCGFRKPPATELADGKKGKDSKERLAALDSYLHKQMWESYCYREKKDPFGEVLTILAEEYPPCWCGKQKCE